MPPDPLKALLELVRAAARDGTTEALLTHDPAPSKPAPPLLDKRAVAHALGVSTATVDRLSRDGRVPYVHVGDVRRFDLDADRCAVAPSHGPIDAQPTGQEQGSDRLFVPAHRLQQHRVVRLHVVPTSLRIVNGHQSRQAP